METLSKANIQSKTSVFFIILTLLFPMELAAAAYSAYVMGYFKESPNGSENTSALHIAVSMDGMTWIPLNQNNLVISRPLKSHPVQ